MTQTQFVHEGQSVRIRTDFDGGALARVDEAETNLFDIWPYAEDEYVDGSLQLDRPASGVRDGANFAFLFCIEECRGQSVALRIHIPHERLSEDDCPIIYANPDFPVYSYDGAHWHRTDRKTCAGGPGLADERVVTVRETFTEDRAWFSFQYPFTNDHLVEWTEQASVSPLCTPEVVGESTQGRPIRGYTITEPGVPAGDKRNAWYIGLQHPAETGAGWGLEGMAEFLLSDDPQAVVMRSNWTFTFVPIINVDSIAEGRGRIHSTGVNLNREWEKPDPVSEIRTIKETMDHRAHSGQPIHFFADIHGFSSPGGMWFAPVLEDTTYPASLRPNYALLQDALRRQLPGMRYRPGPYEGYAMGYAGRKHGALSICVDGWVFAYAGKPPSLASHFDKGERVFELADMKAAGAAFIRSMCELK